MKQQMQCQFKSVIGLGKFDVDTFSISVTSKQSASREVKDFIRKNHMSSLGHFITSIFIPASNGKKVEVVSCLDSKTIDKMTEAIQAKYKARHRS